MTNYLSRKLLILPLLVLGLFVVNASPVSALYFSDLFGDLLTFSGTSPEIKIDFNKGGSDIRDDGNLWINTDDHLFFHAPVSTVFWTDTIEFWPNLSQPTLDFKKGDSKIYDNGDLFIVTDDNLHLQATVIAKGLLRPDQDDTYDLGSSTYEWQDLYIDGAGYIDQLGENLDANTHLITNIGNAGTDFLANGGLTLANALTVSAGTSTFAGNVGIGTTGPSTQLHITGDLTIGGDDLFMATNTANYFLMADGTNYNPITPTAAVTGLGLDAGGAGDIWVEKAGDTMTGGLQFDFASGDPTIIFDTQGADKFIMGVDDSVSDNFTIETGGTLGASITPPFVITSGGNVGIGTTGPSSKLEVAGNITLGDDNWIGIGSVAERIIFDSAGDVAVMGGNLGIGTTNPGTTKLKIVSDIGSGLYSLRVYNTTGASRIGIVDSASKISDISSIPSTDTVFDASRRSALEIRTPVGYNLNLVGKNNISFRTNGDTGAYDRMYITNTGNVGIGTTGPSQKLEVAGSVLVTGGSFIDDGTTLSVPDYVFEVDYSLPTLSELRDYVRLNKHLPNTPSMGDTEGWAALSLQGRDMRLLEKIEENVLYIFNLDKRITENETQISNIKDQITRAEGSPTRSDNSNLKSDDPPEEEEREGLWGWFLDKFEQLGVLIEENILRVKELQAEKICLGETCVTEEELKQLLEDKAK